MTAIVILNVVLAIFVVAAILTLLGWGIVTDNRWFEPPGPNRGSPAGGPLSAHT
jgi:hypothetical protein